MAIAIQYEGKIDSAAILSAMTNLEKTLVIPYSNGQRVLILEQT